MKLRNKKTGGVDDFKIDATGLEWLGYTSLREFCEVWEDYEEPKVYYYINSFGVVQTEEVGKFVAKERARKEIGNHLKTEEKSEKAVEKLKAWKRLKDGGVKFELASIANDDTATIFARFPNREKFQDLNGNLYKIFGGEE